MREEMIKRHNSRVKSGDLTYHLGDMFWKDTNIDEALEIISRLNGNHYYIYGNHEEVMERSLELRSKFVWCKDIVTLRKTEFSHKIVLCHYAMLVWPGSHSGNWQLYGHSHGELSKGVPDTSIVSKLNSIDVGVDCHNYYPVSLEEVAQKIKAKQNVSGWTKHYCIACNHEFSNYSKLDEVCSRCLERMVTK